jgi:hypothetical protein
MRTGYIRAGANARVHLATGGEEASDAGEEGDRDGAEAAAEEA